MQQDPELWAGSVSGGMREDRFVQAVEEAMLGPQAGRGLQGAVP